MTPSSPTPLLPLNHLQLFPPQSRLPHQPHLPATLHSLLQCQSFWIPPTRLHRLLDPPPPPPLLLPQQATLHRLHRLPTLFQRTLLKATAESGGGISGDVTEFAMVPWDEAFGAGPSHSTPLDLLRYFPVIHHAHQLTHISIFWRQSL